MSSSALTSSDNSIDAIWGPGFIGFIVSVGLYGLTISQTLHYYQYYYHEDELPLKLLVLIVFSMDSFHVYATAHSFWRYFIEGRVISTLGNALPWQLIASLMTTYVITFFVQSYYGYRVFKVSRHNKIILGAICFFALVQLASGTAFVAEEFNANANARTDIFSNSALLILELSSTVLGDLLITCATVWYLRAERTGMQMTEKLVHRLVIHAINMGMVGGLVALVQLIVFVARRREMLFFAPNLVVSKCYVNSLLATLNARHSIRDARDAWMDDDNAHGIVLHRVGHNASAGLWGRHKTPMDMKELRRFRLAMQKHADSMSMATAGDEEVPHDRKYADRGDAKSALKNYEIKAQGSVFVMGDLAA
ncbi:uncharacterized protein BT62DRAFT_173201 [Guyanagaster necrorhizus]|uniref:DUF6534 domain-containing protein n=1 Tax=Guyanagaster necrorhizus TaxID=856835 RepID=A0A9P7VQQ2_9AGAR|nr:uncharacterized protein BT62DRAFT_173201 [Guyanagaster necrorhizus MCA 3950]KAG7445678.1 hypothetical protein BT62DRAFT_173201 [Guyanagaster necrorhizus MCA 3950]